MKRVPPSERTRQSIAKLLKQGTTEEDPLSELIRLALQSMVEEALEGAVRELLGRDYYRHGSEGKGYRNGYRRGRVKSSEGEVSYSVPQVREVDSETLKALRKLLRGRELSDSLRLGARMHGSGNSAVLWSTHGHDDRPDLLGLPHCRQDWQRGMGEVWGM